MQSTQAIVPPTARFAPNFIQRCTGLLQVPACQVLPYCLIAALTACSFGGSVPGETLTSGGQQREVRDRVLAQTTKENAQCKSRRIVDTQVVDVYSDARAEVERWTVEECGRRVNYLVSFPPKGKSSSFLVRPE